MSNLMKGQNLIRGQKRYFNAVSKLVEAGGSICGKKTQSTILRSFNEKLNMMQMDPPKKITDYIVEERMTEPRMFIVFGKIVVPWESIWNVK